MTSRIASFDSEGDRLIAPKGGALLLGAADWQSNAIMHFQKYTGLDTFAIVVRSNFGFSTSPAKEQDGQGYTVHGGGDAAYYNGRQGGIIQVTGPDALGGYADWTPAGPNADWATIPNPQVGKLFAAYGRQIIARAPSAATAESFGFFADNVYWGIGFVGAVDHWCYVRGGIPGLAVIAESDTPIDVDPTGVAPGTANDWCVGCFDRRNVGANFNLTRSGFKRPVALEPVGNLPNFDHAPYWANQGVQAPGATDDRFDSQIIYFAEF